MEESGIAQMKNVTLLELLQKAEENKRELIQKIKLLEEKLKINDNAAKLKEE